MAEQKSTRRSSAAGKKPTRRESMLRLRTEPRHERRYEPRSSAIAMLTVIALSLGGVAVGAGTYGQWFRGDAEGPHAYAAYLLAAGTALLVAAAIFGDLGAKPVRVGDAGVGVEKEPGEIERIGWNLIQRVSVDRGTLTLQASGTALGISIGAHPQAAARVLAEARARIPERVKDVPEGAVPPLDESAGVKSALELPQVAGLHCRATEKLIAFEKDARLCGACGEVYHKDGVPSRCEECGAPLRS